MLAERVELLLKLREAARCRPGSEPAFESLVKALDLSLRLGMAGRPVLLADAEHREQVFERVAAAGEPGGVDAAVIGQRGCGRAVLIHSREEGGHDLIAADRLMDRAGQQIPRVVIEPVQDLHIAAAEKPRVGEVRLPHLVGLACLEAGVGAAGPFARLGRDQPRLMQDPPDRGGRGSPQPLPFQMPRDRHRPRIEPVRGQLRAQRDHPLADQHRGRRSVRFRAARAGLERVQTSVPIGDEKTMEMPAGEPVLGSGSGHGQLLGDDLENSNASTRHPRTVSPPPDGRARRSPLRRRPTGSASATTAPTPSLNPSAR